jgi:arsenite methyltransferase
MAEFSGIRSQLYKECLKEFPRARDEDFDAMNKYLNPQKSETILEVGAGSGFFSGVIADKCKQLIVSDPSSEQLEEVKSLNKDNIELIPLGGDKLNLQENSVDAIWSFGALHHCFDKTSAFKNFAKILKSNGRIVIIDVFQNSNLAKHFDEQVAKFCATGHEVAFWTKEFTDSLCYVAGLKKPTFVDLDIQWKFNSKEEIGKFVYKIHAMTGTTEEECLKGAEEILGIEEKDGKFCLNWPLTAILTGL